MTIRTFENFKRWPARPLPHAALTAYGFDAKKDLLARLLAFNQSVALRIEAGHSVTGPGVPKGYPKPKDLVTEDCILPET